MPEPPEPPEVAYAEYPVRRCRQPVTEDGLIDHFCELPDMHPGPCCPRNLPSAVRRRQEWEAANPGWQAMAGPEDPFEDITQRLKESM